VSDLDDETIAMGKTAADRNDPQADVRRLVVVSQPRTIVQEAPQHSVSLPSCHPLATYGIESVVDRAERLHADGYMLGVLPVGGTILQELELFERCCASSSTTRRFQAVDRNARLVKTVDLERITLPPGSCQAIERGSLLELLVNAATDARFSWGNAW
jgi:hypothetical protein